MTEQLMRVESWEEIPASPEAVEINIPVESDAAESAPTDLVSLGKEVDVSRVKVLDPVHFEVLPDEPSTDLSSVFDPGHAWTVRHLDVQGDDVELALGRRGGVETSISLPREHAGGIDTGSVIASDSLTLLKERHIFGFLKTNVEFRPDPGTPPIESDIWLPLLRLHCPHHKGCEAEYESSEAAGHEGSFELSVFGVGGGAGKALTCTVAQSFTTKAKCMEIAIPAKLVLQFGETYVNGTSVSYGMRASIADIKPKGLTRRGLPPGHGCGLKFDEVEPKSLWTLDLLDKAADGDAKWSMKLATVTEGNLSLGIELEKSPVKLGFKYVRKTEVETTISAEFGSGARYAAYPPPDEGGFEVLWTP